MTTFADLLTLGGVVAVTTGAWLVHPAAGFIVLGVSMMLAGVGVARNIEP